MTAAATWALVVIVPVLFLVAAWAITSDDEEPT